VSHGDSMTADRILNKWISVRYHCPAWSMLFTVAQTD
jgi:hypothetical protein